jgi:hypothetical protein
MNKNQVLSKSFIALLALAMLMGAGGFVSSPAYADEGGVSFWFPGQYGSLAAVPSAPGWSLPLIYFHTTQDAEGSKEFTKGGKVRLGVEDKADVLIAVPTYVFATPVFGGQAVVSVAGAFGRIEVDADATLTGPGGGTLSGSESDSNTGFADLYPSATLRWNHGVHNTMIYLMGGVPVGSYDAGRLANIGTNHWSMDAGGGYTYLNTKTGREFSAVAGLTYNFENPDTDYQNGIDAHLDWGASQFLSEQWHVGLVGYFYYQITGDSGAGAVLGDFKSRVNAIGPQVGYLFKIGGKDAYLNLKGYWEFGAKNRPEGWNAWLTLAIPL